jgi:hypothetical protein
MDRFPLPAVNDEDHRWFCPAFEQVIDHGFCWECCFAGSIGPRGTAEELRRWIGTSQRFASLEDFHRICACCEHCQWSRGSERDQA